MPETDTKRRVVLDSGSVPRARTAVLSPLSVLAPRGEKLPDVPGWGVIPTIRVLDVRAVLDHYRDVLSFTIERDHPANSTVTRGEARIMVEPAGSLYSDDYNAAIRERIGSKAPNALYIEELDIDAYYDRLRKAGARIMDPLAPRPWGQREFTVEDGAGNWLTFWSKV